MKNISNACKLSALLLTGAFIRLPAQEANSELIDGIQAIDIFNENNDEKHASFDIASVAISELALYNQNDEKHASSHVEEIIINDNKYDSHNQNVQDDNFLDVIADDVRIEAPHAPRDTSSVLAKLSIATKIAHNVSVNFYEETIKPAVVGLWNSVTSLL